MSSLAAARADNFYYPPEYRAEHGSLNKFRGSHPLGDRAKKIHEGILVIRFEMPYKVFCNKCNEVIAKGVRFNAEKRTVGHYFSTKILEFSMKCCFCDNTLKIQTDPKSCEYIPTAGLKRKVETFAAEDAETMEYRSAEERQEINNDPMLKLETTAEDLTKAKQSHNQIESLIALNELKDSSDVQYDLNLKVRKRFREWKKEEIAREVEEKKIRNFVIPLVTEDPRDVNEAASIDFCTNPVRLGRRIKQRVLETATIFPQPKKQKPTTRSVAPKSSSSSSASSAPLLVPCADHKALSQVIPQGVVKRPVRQVVATQQERRSRLHGDLEKIRNVKRNAARASMLIDRDFSVSR